MANKNNGQQRLNSSTKMKLIKPEETDESKKTATSEITPKNGGKESSIVQSAAATQSASSSSVQSYITDGSSPLEKKREKPTLDDSLHVIVKELRLNDKEARIKIIDRLAPYLKIDYMYVILLRAAHFTISGLFDRSVPSVEKQHTFYFAKVGKTANDDVGFIQQQLLGISLHELPLVTYLDGMSVSSSKSRLYSINHGLKKSRYIMSPAIVAIVPMDDHFSHGKTSETQFRNAVGLPLKSDWYQWINDSNDRGSTSIGSHEWVVTTGEIIEMVKRVNSLETYHQFIVRGKPPQTRTYMNEGIFSMRVQKSSGAKDILFERQWRHGKND
jgi:hypothetical protein